MTNKANEFNAATEKLDIKLLERLILRTTPATDRNGARAIYYFPLKPEYTDICDFIFQKYGINMEKYQSSLSPHPILRISFSQIDKLSESSHNFLFAVNVNPDKLEQRMNEIVAEMQKTK